MPNPDALHCWEIVAQRHPLLTVHNAPRARAVEHAEREAARLPGLGNVVRLRQVARCICTYGTHVQPATGGQAIIAAPDPAPEGR